MEEPKPKPRLLDNLLEIYIKIGGFIGVALSIGTFVGICGASYWAFFIKGYLHIPHGGVGDVIMIVSTLCVAGAAALTVFFTASIFWLPFLIGLFFLFFLGQDALLRIHQLHHAAH